MCIFKYFKLYIFYIEKSMNIKLDIFLFFYKV